MSFHSCRRRPRAIVRGAAGCIEPFEPRLLLSAGQLDGGFGSGGKIVTTFSPPLQISALAVQQDGKIIAAGTDRTPDATVIHAVVARFNPDGTFDQTFGTGGRVAFDFGGTFAFLDAVAIGQDGRIFVGGATRSFDAHGDSNDALALAALTKDGRLDPGFGEDGTVTVDRNPDYHAQEEEHVLSLRLWRGRIVFGGFADQNLIVGRLSARGGLDHSFGGTGVSELDFGGGGSDEIGRDVAVDGRGRVLIVGETMNPEAHLVMARLTSNGRMDRGFGTGGRVISGAMDFAHVFVGGNGAVTVAGRVPTDAGHAAALRRFTAAGRLVECSGGDGEARLAVPGFSGISSVMRDSDGELVWAGTTASVSQPDSNDIFIARTSPAGTLDRTFGDGDGIKVVDGFADDQAVAAAMLKGGAVLTSAKGVQFASDGSTDSRDVLFRFDGRPGTPRGPQHAGAVTPGDIVEDADAVDAGGLTAADLTSDAINLGDATLLERVLGVSGNSDDWLA